MLRSYRRYILAAVGFIIAAGLLGVGFQKIDDWNRYQAPAENPTNAAPKSLINTARIADALEAMRADQSSKDEGERARRDLDAQEGAARWTKWTAWSSVVQLFVSGLGLAALIYTLRQTDISLKEARRANRITLIEAKRARREAKESEAVTAAALKAARDQADAAILSQQAQPFVANVCLTLTPVGDNTQCEILISFGNSGQSVYELLRVAVKTKCDYLLEPNPSPLTWYSHEYGWHVLPNTVVHPPLKPVTFPYAYNALMEYHTTKGFGIWVYGAVEFTDRIAGKRVQRFCFKVTFKDGTYINHGFAHDGSRAYWSDIQVGDA